VLGLLLADCVGRDAELVEVSRLLMVDSMRVRLDQCKEVLLIASELGSMRVLMSVFYILVNDNRDQWGCRGISGDRIGSALIVLDHP
jgi:hypothetical protein